MSDGPHVLVIGAGGLGCAAGWALAVEGVGRITFIDSDRVERSNLPRQVLFEDEDIGRPKALAAAARLASTYRVVTEGVHDRFDERRLDSLGARVDVWIDATDGAWVKDWVARAAVSMRKPLAHAAALGAEGRLLAVPAGGRPCLACLFGRIEDEGGRCADLGVYNGAVGTTGALAARLALHLAADRVERSRYDVLDFASGRALSLGAAPDPHCPVCATGRAPLDLGPLDVGPPCRVPSDEDRAADVEAWFDETLPALRLETTRCPLNLLRVRDALGALAPGRRLLVRLGEEGAQTVPDGVRAAGHRVLARRARGAGLDLVVEAGEGGRSSGPAIDLERYARQVVLDDLGVVGQRRLLDATVVVHGGGVEARVAARYLAAAGVTVARCAGSDVACVEFPDRRRFGASADGGVRELSAGAFAAPASGALAVARGALLADEVERRILHPHRARRGSLDLHDLGQGIAKRENMSA